MRRVLIRGYVLCVHLPGNVQDVLEYILAKDAANRRITNRVPDLRVSTDRERIEFQSNSGLVLAVLTDASSRLASRDRSSAIGPRSPVAISSTPVRLPGRFVTRLNRTESVDRWST